MLYGIKKLLHFNYSFATKNFSVKQANTGNSDLGPPMERQKKTLGQSIVFNKFSDINGYRITKNDN